MHISRIEIIGFKSFMDRTNVELTPEITAVIGPNGCGKSNIVDALRWTLGEQSARQLRGSSMEDVIFNGSDKRRALGMAEVLITFRADHGSLPVPYHHLSELTISRRLYRSGESEYYINKVACRLKDITRLFLDTGAGNRAYSIIEQGQIETLVNLKPQERRSVIEEAAGINRYKFKRQEALRKMEATQQNLVRIQDIVSEVNRQANSLKRQAAKAERYRKMSAEIRTLDRQLMAQAWRKLLQEEEAAAQEVLRLTWDEAIAGARLQILENELQERRTVLLDAEQKFSQLQEEGRRLKTEIQRLESAVEGFTREKENLHRQRERNLQQVTHHQERLASHEQKAGVLNSEAAARQEEEARLGKACAACRAELTAVEAELREKEARLEAAKEELFEVMNEVSRAKNRWESLEHREQGLNERRSRLQKTATELTSRLEEINRKSQEAEAAILAREDERKNLEAARQAALARLVEAENGLSAAREEERGKQEKLLECQSLLKSWRSLEDNFTGYRPAVRELMLKQKQEDLGLKGLAADILEVPPAYERAVEAVLGERLQYVLTENQESGRNAVRYLKEKALGRSSFIPRHPRDKAASPPPPVEVGIIGALADLVRVKEGYQALAPYLLGEILVVQDLEQALACAKKTGSDYTLVTLDGEVLDAWGVLHGGRDSAGSQGLLEKRRRIKELEADQARLTGEREAASRRVEELALARAAVREEIKTCDERINQAKLAMVGARKDLEALGRERDSVAKDARAGEAEARQVETQLAGIAEEKAQIKSALTTQEEAGAGLEEAVKVKREELEQTSAAREKLAADVTARAVAHKSAEERLRSLAEQCRALETSRVETVEQIRHFQEEAAANETAVKRLDEMTQEKNKTLMALIQEELKHREVSLAAQEAYESLRGGLTEEEKARGGFQSDLAAVRDNLNQANMAASKLSFERDHYVREAGERFGEDMESLLKDEVSELDPAEGEEKLKKLRADREALGDVNLTALEEYEELAQRQGFLTSQKEDLEKSIAALSRLINRINRVSRQRFKETFDQVSERFKEVFPRLFNGGRAELVLTNEEDLLDTGVDIIAQPPGKKLQNITLLSGGEKALTAVALIFSLFLIKPSPFCLLDEVDAPLDDANIDRFNGMVQEIAKMSQVILITHNKKTMQIAKVLYGVTMEDPGISKLLSVRIRDVDDDGTILNSDKIKLSSAA